MARNDLFILIFTFIKFNLSYFYNFKMATRAQQISKEKMTDEEAKGASYIKNINLVMFVFYFLVFAMLIAVAFYFKFIVAFEELPTEGNDKISEIIANMKAQKTGYNISVDHGLG